MNIETIKALNKLKNNSLVGKQRVSISANKLTSQIVSLLYKEGYLLSYKKINRIGSSFMEVVVKNSSRVSIFRDLKICSSPSNTLFLSFKQVSDLNTKKNLYVLSTNKGLITGTLCKSLKVGGTLLFYC